MRKNKKKYSWQVTPSKIRVLLAKRVGFPKKIFLVIFEWGKILSTTLTFYLRSAELFLFLKVTQWATSKVTLKHNHSGTLEVFCRTNSKSE